MTGNQCAHIYNDCSMCKSSRLHNDSAFCKKHYADLQDNSDADRIQDKRILRIQNTKRELRLRIGFQI